MKKKLSLLMIVLMAVAAFAIQVGKRASATTWTVAGNSTELFGSAWDPTATANDMTLDGDVYKWTKTDVALPAFTEVQFKVCGDHAWTVAFPAENYGFTIPENGKYTVVITFNAATEEITATATKTGDATFPDAEITKVQICGATDASWTNRIDFGLTKGEGNVYTGVLDASAYEDDVEFKLVVNGDTWIGFDQLTMNAPDGWVEKPEGNDNFLLKNSSTRYKSYNITATWVSNALANKGWTVKIEGKELRTKDVAISPASGDITAAINAELGTQYFAKNLTINLVENGAYTISAAIKACGNIAITGAAGATIDASALEGNMIEYAVVESPTGWTAANVSVKSVSVKGLKKALFYSACKNYVAENFIIDDCVVEQAADATTIDYTKGSTAKNITVTNSTFYAATATTKSFYSSQGGQKYTEYDTAADAMQTFKFANNTMYNLAPGKNFFSHRQNSQKWMTYDVKNNIFVDCGKSGQVIKGMNGGGSSANPVWDIDGNVFNFKGADTSASETTGDDAEPVKNSIAGRVLFKDAAKGDFGGQFVLAPTTTSMPEAIGDPRWTLTSAASFAINIALGIENGTVTTTPSGYAAKGEKVTINGTPASGFSVESYSVKKGEEDVSVGADATFTMPEAEVLVSAVFSKSPVDIAIAAADITGGDITAAIAAKKAALAEGETVGNITITLAEGTYTVSSPIEAPASLTINGAAGAVIDASALEAALITTPAGDLALWKEASLTVKDVTIKGVKKGVYASAGKNYLYNDFQIDNCVIEIAATSGLEFDFRKGGVAKNFTINKSTIYAPEATTNSLYTSQSAQKGTDAPGVTVQTFAITNSTLYNLAKGKNFFTHRQSNQKWLAYTIKNSVFLNVGKSGQVVKGINQGQSGANPTWDIDGNIFNFEGKDTSADETTGDDAEPVKNSIAGVVTFTDAAAGDFNFTFLAAPGTTAPATVGDPRWTLTPATAYTITLGEVKNGTITAVPYAAAGDKIYPKMTPAEGYAMDKIPVIKNGEGEDVTSTITFGQDETGVFFVMPAFNITVDYEFSKLYTITLPTETTHGTITIVDGDGNPMADPKFVAGKEVKFKVADLTSGYKVVVKNGETEITLNEGDHSKFDYYFTMPEGDVTFTIDEATGIIGINVDGVEDDIFSDGKPVYNLSGQRVFKGYKGIVIKNGKKIMVK